MTTIRDAELKRPDSAGRITIGKENKDKLYAVQYLANGDILLSPVVVRHQREAWLYDNPVAMSMVDQGLAESARGEAHTVGIFAQFADDDLDEE